ncbi:MAG: 4Fe-4S dicluster domain-containing protein [Acidimicrobiales bacterium]|nr:4Fe-4S dicluster domain-containing protein [Acidimicrobiales bacterium]
MTTTYDPFHPKYFDESDLRQELTRVYDLCHGCRLCFKFCPSFPTLFRFIDDIPNQDAAEMTPAQQDQVVDECFNCKLCYINCPYIPGQHEWELDFPRLMLRAKQVLHRERKRSVRTKLTDLALGSTDLVGKVNSAAAPLVNKALSKEGSPPRKLMEKAVGISSERVLPPYAKQRFSKWFDHHDAPADAKAEQSRAVLFPTCLVEYQDTHIGQAMVQVYERNGVTCSLPDGQNCCGAPFLHQGDVEKFRKLARKNITVLADAIRAADAETGGESVVVVPEPTCGFVLKQDYVDYVGGPDAELVASRTKDACEHLVDLHKGEGTELDLEFAGEVPEAITYHAPCHLRAQNIGLRSRDLMKLTGAKITVVAECSGIDGTWGLRAENLDMARGVAKKMAGAIERADAPVVAGDCSLANGGITLETGATPVHPLEVVARAYGLGTAGSKEERA